MKEIGIINLYQHENILSVNSKGKELSSLAKLGEYKENGIITQYRKLTKAFLSSNEEYGGLENLGLTHAYFLEDESPLSHIFCFEREGDFSSIIYSKEADDLNALRGLTLAFAQKIEDQDFIFEFVKK